MGTGKRLVVYGQGVYLEFWLPAWPLVEGTSSRGVVGQNTVRRREGSLGGRVVRY